MTDIKCIRCGALTIGTLQICKVCEIELNPIRPSTAGAVFYPAYLPRSSSNQARVTIGPFNSITDILGPTILLFTKNFWLITKISVVIVAPYEILHALSFVDIKYDPQLTAGLTFLSLACIVLTAPALIYALMQVMQTGIAPGVNESYRWGFSKLGKLSVVALLTWTLTSLGLLLCIVPGIIATLSLSLVFPIAILEKGSPLEVLQSSYELTKGHRWKILGAYVVVLILLFTLSLPLEFAGEYLAARDPAFWPAQAAGAIFGFIMQQSTMVLSLVTYLSIRALWSQSTQ
ncbi:MAG TPA: hypothetical protein VJ656_01440 [Pyrinomonadaceae bacterium]|nr:hypothetical protein [Pyrinomonadaceae bacterium]